MRQKYWKSGKCNVPDGRVDFDNDAAVAAVLVHVGTAAVLTGNDQARRQP